MYEFELVNKRTNEHEILIGHNLALQMALAGFNPEDWTLINTECVDDDWFAY